MGKIIKVNKIVDDAQNSAYKYIEAGNLKDGVKYLEYVYENNENPDDYLSYALITSYYNLGRYNKAKEIIKDVDVDKIENPSIKEVVKQIIDEISKFEKEIGQSSEKDNVYQVTVDERINKLIKNKKFLEIIQDEQKVKKNLEFNYKISKIRENLVIDKKILKEFSNEIELSILNFILDYDLEKLLTLQNVEVINYNLDIIEMNEYFEPEINNYIEVSYLFKKFYRNYKNKYAINDIHKVYSLSSEYDEHMFFLYQGIISNIFNEMFQNGHATLEFKNDLKYDLVTYYNEGLIPKGLISQLNFEYEDFDLNTFYEKVDTIQEKCYKISNNEDFLNDTFSLIKKYLKRNLDHYQEINDEELVNKILIYIHYSSYELPDNVQKKIISKIDLNDKHLKEKYEEINKITMI